MQGYILSILFVIAVIILLWYVWSWYNQPTLSITSPVKIDLSSQTALDSQYNPSNANKTRLYLQSKGNVPSVFVKEPGVVSVVMQPDAVDGNKGETNRRRIEFSWKKISLRKGQSGTWGIDVRIDGPINGQVNGFYHVVQIKYNETDVKLNTARVEPPATISIDDKNQLVFREQAGQKDPKKVPLFNLNDIIGKWVHIEITVDNSPNGLVQWLVTCPDLNTTKKGKYNSTTLGGNYDDHPDATSSQVYFKFGQYRSLDVKIDYPTSVSYQNIWGQYD